MAIALYFFLELIVIKARVEKKTIAFGVIGESRSS